MLAAALVAAFVATAWAGQGYYGFGHDEFRYVTAAQCAVAHGWCAPETHWAARYPVVAPIAAALTSGGDARTALQLLASGWMLVALGALAWLAHTVANWRAAVLACGFLLSAATVARMNGAVGADVPELALILASSLAMLIAARRDAVWLAVVAGVIGAVAVGARTTAAVTLAVPGLLLLIRHPRLGLATLAGGLAGLAGEAAWQTAHGLSPLTSWQLALGHTRVFSDALNPGVDTSRSPLLNPDFIGGWRKLSGIEVHWLADPLLNLVAAPELRLFAGLAVLVGGLAVIERTGRSRLTTGLLLFAAWQFAATTYILGIDPTPRMFLPALAALSLAMALCVSRSRWQDAVAGVLIAALLIVTLQKLQAPDLLVLEARVAAVDKAEGRPAMQKELASSLILTPLPALFDRSGPVRLFEPEGGADCPAGARRLAMASLQDRLPAWLQQPGARRWLCLMPRGAG